MLVDVLTVDRAVESIGFGWFQIKLSLFTGLVWVCICICFRPRYDLYCVGGTLSLTQSINQSIICICLYNLMVAVGDSISVNSGQSKAVRWNAVKQHSATFIVSEFSSVR